LSVEREREREQTLRHMRGRKLLSAMVRMRYI